MTAAAKSVRASIWPSVRSSIRGDAEPGPPPTDPVLSIAASDADKAEGDAGEITAFVFTVTRTVNTTGTTNVDYAVTGSATVLPNAATTADFAGGRFQTDTVTFGPGQSIKTVPIYVRGNDDDGPDREFTVTLSNPTGGATIQTNNAQGFIRDDDAASIGIYDSNFIDGGRFSDWELRDPAMSMRGPTSLRYKPHTLLDGIVPEPTQASDLTSWTKTGAGTFNFEKFGGQDCYIIDNTGQGVSTSVEPNGGATSPLPCTQSAMVSRDGGPWLWEQETSRPGTGGKARFRALPGEIVRFYEPDFAEGPETFGLDASAGPVYCIGAEKGVGAIPFGAVTQRCLASFAPEDATDITDSGGAVTTAHARADVPAGMLAALDANSEMKGVTQVYKTTFSAAGRAYALGGSGTGDKYVKALVWAEAGTTGAEVGLEDAQVATATGTEQLEWVGGTAAAVAGTDRLSIAAAGAGAIWWVGQSLVDGTEDTCVVPTEGSARTKANDIPLGTALVAVIGTPQWTNGFAVQVTGTFKAALTFSSKVIKLYGLTTGHIEIQGSTGAGNWGKFLGTVIKSGQANSFTVRTADELIGQHTLRHDLQGDDTTTGGQELFLNGVTTGARRLIELPASVVDRSVLGSTQTGGSKANVCIERVSIGDGMGPVT